MPKMVLAIQSEESARSFVERNLFVNGKHSSEEVFRKYPKINSSTSDLEKISRLLGWSGCEGFNRLLHEHTDYPMTTVFKNIQDISYSGSEYLLRSHRLGSGKIEAAFCPICVQEDIKKLGFTFWRRAHCSELNVCAEHNVILVKRCPACGLGFFYDEHSLDVLWKGCGKTCIANCPSTSNTDPDALKKAQIYTDILRSPYHISVEAALAVLRDRSHLIKVSKHSIWITKYRRLPDEMFERLLHVVSESRLENRLPPKESNDFIIQGILETYDTFADFVDDIRAYGHELRPINSLWSTYLAGNSRESTHFVQEDYEAGVGLWSCPFPVLARSGYWRGRPTTYPCCNFKPPRRPGHQLKPEPVRRPPPGIYRRGQL